MPEINDLRSFIDVLEENGQLATISQEVSINHEIADITASLARSDGGAAFFNNVKETKMPIFAGGVSSHKRTALALECEPESIIDVMGEALKSSNGIPTQLTTEADWHENCLTGDDVDLGVLPIPKHSRGDGGSFITGAVSVTKDPVSGRGNLSYNRMLVLDKNILGFNVNEWRDVGTFMKSRPDPEAPFPVALAMGLDPAIMIAAGVRTPVDELLIAGAIRNEGIKVCNGKTVDIDIPAHSEIVIEGHIRPAERAPEGPLAEFHGYHGEMWDSPTLEVSAISFRNDPIYQTIIPGWSEHIYIGNILPREPLLRKHIRHIDPNADVIIPPYGNGFMAVIQIDRDNPGTPKNLAMAAMSAHINIRNVVVVDRDVNMHESSEVLWAITNRVQWERDVFQIGEAQGHEMDPTADKRGVSTKVGIDATYKRERREYGERVAYPSIDLSSLLKG